MVLPWILYLEVLEDDDVTFFFNSDGTPFYDADIAVFKNILIVSNAVVTTTVQYEGNQPAATPKTGNIQAPSGVGLIIPIFDMNISGSVPTSMSVRIRASDTVNTADGTVLEDFGAVLGAFSTARAYVIPANKFLTIEIYAKNISPTFTTRNITAVERGVNTKDLDPILQ